MINIKGSVFLLFVLCAVNVHANIYIDKVMQAIQVGDFANAEKILIEGVQNNDAESMDMLGQGYLMGGALSQNIRKAEELLMLAEKNNEFDGMNMLGRYYLFGAEVKKNEKKGLAILTRLFDKGYPQAGYEIALYYDDMAIQIGNEEFKGAVDSEKAYKWYRKSAEAGSMNGQQGYGIFLMGSEAQKAARKDYQNTNEILLSSYKWLRLVLQRGHDGATRWVDFHEKQYNYSETTKKDVDLWVQAWVDNICNISPYAWTNAEKRKCKN